MATNTLSVYDPIFYAQEALLALEKNLGMASLVHRGYDKQPQQRGSVITIKSPATFSAANAPSSAQDLVAGEVQITLDQWKEVKFELTDKELSATGEEIIRDHIRPAAYALADDIDQALLKLYKFIPWYHDVASTAAHTDLLSARKILRDNKVPLHDGNLFAVVDSDMEADLLGNSAFTQYTGAGDAGVTAQIQGSLGRRFGMEILASQNIQTHTKGSASTGTLAANGAAAAGATKVNLDAAAVTGTLVAGDSLVFAGHSQRYVVTATATASSNAFTNVGIYPALKEAVADDEVVTVSLDNHSAALAFHRHAFVLATAPLSELGGQLGAKIATVADPQTGLSLRSRLFYDGSNSKVIVALDVLYGVKTLEPNRAVRLRN